MPSALADNSLRDLHKSSDHKRHIRKPNPVIVSSFIQNNSVSRLGRISRGMRPIRDGDKYVYIAMGKMWFHK